MYSTAQKSTLRSSSEPSPLRQHCLDLKPTGPHCIELGVKLGLAQSTACRHLAYVLCLTKHRTNRATGTCVMRRALCVAICCSSLFCAVRSLSPTPLTHFLHEASQEDDWMVQIRRELHQWPELMYQEHNTSSFLRGVLDNLNIPYK